MFPFVLLPVEVATRLHAAHHGSDPEAVTECIGEILELAFGHHEDKGPKTARAIHYWEDISGGGRRYAVKDGWLYTPPRPGILGWLFGNLPPILVKVEPDFFSEIPGMLQGMMKSMGVETPPLGGDEGAVLAMVREEGADEETEPTEDPMETLRKAALAGDPVAMLRWWSSTGGTAPDGGPLAPQVVLECSAKVLQLLDDTEIHLDEGRALALEGLELVPREHPWGQRVSEWLETEGEAVGGGVVPFPPRPQNRPDGDDIDA